MQSWAPDSCPMCHRAAPALAAHPDRQVETIHPSRHGCEGITQPQEGAHGSQRQHKALSCARCPHTAPPMQSSPRGRRGAEGSEMGTVSLEKPDRAALPHKRHGHRVVRGAMGTFWGNADVLGHVLGLKRAGMPGPLALLPWRGELCLGNGNQGTSRHPYTSQGQQRLQGGCTSDGGQVTAGGHGRGTKSPRRALQAFCSLEAFWRRSASSLLQRVPQPCLSFPTWASPTGWIRREVQMDPKKGLRMLGELCPQDTGTMSPPSPGIVSSPSTPRKGRLPEPQPRNAMGTSSFPSLTASSCSDGHKKF